MSESLSEGDKAIVEKITKEIVKDLLVIHTSTCPHAMSVRNWTFLIIGACLGSGLGGGGIVAILLNIIK